jgi:hypothetical protein
MKKKETSMNGWFFYRTEKVGEKIALKLFLKK